MILSKCKSNHLTSLLRTLQQLPIFHSEEKSNPSNGLAGPLEETSKALFLHPLLFPGSLHSISAVFWPQASLWLACFFGSSSQWGQPNCTTDDPWLGWSTLPWRNNEMHFIKLWMLTFSWLEVVSTVLSRCWSGTISHMLKKGNNWYSAVCCVVRL